MADEFSKLMTSLGTRTLDGLSMIMEVTPQKKGGTFHFPWGGGIVVPFGLFGKKESIVAKMIAPSERHLHIPKMRPDEKLLSEVYLIASKNYTFKKGLTIEIPVYDEDLTLFEMRLMFKKNGSEEDWTQLDFTFNANSKNVSLITDSLGMFVVTSRPKAERFEVSPNGILYNAKINHLITVRFPKKTVDKPMNCEIQIHKIPHEKIELAKQLYGSECNDVLSISEFYDVQCPDEFYREFRRAVSIKIPLLRHSDSADIEQATTLDGECVDRPGTGQTEEDLEGMAVMQKKKDGWELVESNLKFTRSTITFDTKALGRFCIVRCKPGRKPRLKFALPHIESLQEKIRGEILTFVHIQPKLWRMLFEVVDSELEDIITTERTEAGWKRVPKIQRPPEINDEPEFQSRRMRRHRASIASNSDSQSNETDALALVNGSTFMVALGNGIQIRENTPDERKLLQFHQKMTDNYTYFEVVPDAPKPKPKRVEFADELANENKENNNLDPLAAATTSQKHCSGQLAVINIYQYDAEEEQKKFPNRNVIRTYNLSMNDADIAEYHRPPTPEPEPQQEVKALNEVIHMPQTKTIENETATVTNNKVRNFNTPSFARLTKTQRPVQKVSKESKVLTSRSMQILAREIEQGLTLAVHLDLPDSAITGIGFDSLSNGHSLVDVTYKVLLRWKRSFKSKDRDQQVDNLVLALKEMGRFDIAAVVMDRHRQNAELSPDCFKY
ncbi:uncharacterized protein LOC141907043 isoform X2 [Tubulanus polymorphus]|uniref:uncharacterized protein LOC141907043 isoform X2 n=1 Tax=Tubulanus polymorphus TaxID=672921 RepID=UPI003DA456D2